MIFISTSFKWQVTDGSLQFKILRDSINENEFCTSEHYDLKLTSFLTRKVDIEIYFNLSLIH